jgi:hypothetical protein
LKHYVFTLEKTRLIENQLEKKHTFPAHFWSEELQLKTTNSLLILMFGFWVRQHDKVEEREEKLK